MPPVLEGRVRHLSLFTGYGGFELGLRLAGVPFTTIGYVELDEYCQKIIRARIRDGLLDWAPIVPDIRSADFRPLAGVVDLITAGFPCQPYSYAGRRRGAADERNLWPDTLRAIGEVGPGWVLLENVPGLLSSGYAGTVVGQLSEIGYRCEWGLVSASQTGAPHRRDRWWCLAYAEQPRGTGREILTGNKPEALARRETGASIPIGKVPHAPDHRCPGRGRPAEQERQHHPLERGQLPGADGENGAVADAGGIGLAQRQEQHLAQQPPTEGSSVAPDPQSAERQRSRVARGRRHGLADYGWWAAEPGLGRVADEFTNRMDKL